MARWSADDERHKKTSNPGLEKKRAKQKNKKFKIKGCGKKDKSVIKLEEYDQLTISTLTEALIFSLPCIVYSILISSYLRKPHLKPF